MTIKLLDLSKDAKNQDYFIIKGEFIMFEKIRDIIVEQLNVDASEVTMEANFKDDLGADSLDVFQIIMGIEEEYDIEIDNETVEQIQTVRDAAEAVRKMTE